MVRGDASTPMHVRGSVSVSELRETMTAGSRSLGTVGLDSAIPAGTNNIGDVDVASIAAGTNTIGKVIAPPFIDSLMKSDGTLLTIKFKAGSVANMGSNLLGISVVSKQIVVLQWEFSSVAGVTATWQTQSGAAISRAYVIAANAEFNRSWSQGGYFKTVAGDDLDLVLSAANATTYAIAYVEL